MANPHHRRHRQQPIPKLNGAKKGFMEGPLARDRSAPSMTHQIYEFVSYA